MQYWGRCAYDKSLFYLILAKESLDLFLEGERGSKREGGSERRRQGDRETGRQSLCIYKYINTYIHIYIYTWSRSFKYRHEHYHKW